MPGKKNKITVNNIAPIGHLEIPVPESGGVVILEGPNGAGKSRILEAVDSLLTKKGRPDVVDGADKAELSAFGATLTVAQKVSRRGTLTVTTLEGRFSLVDLVKPGIDSPPAADAKRIKAVLQVSGTVKADPALFYDLLDGQKTFDELIPKEAISTPDLVVMASRIKSHLEQHARTAEAQSRQALSKSESDRLSVAEVDLTLEDDSDKLASEYRDAERADSALTEKARSIETLKQRQSEATDSIKKLRADYKGQPLSEARKINTRADADVIKARDEVARLERELAAAKGKLESTQNIAEVTKSALQLAESYENSIGGFEEIIARPITGEVTLDELTSSSERVSNAREALEQGAIVRKAKEQIQKADELRDQSNVLAGEAETLRSAAQSVDGVLSSIVESIGLPLKVRNGRLVTETDRGDEVFDDLSEGEKWKIATEIAVKAVGPGGIIVLPQDAWQDLDLVNQRIIAEQVENTGVIILTAQARKDSTNTELTVEVFEAHPLA